MVISSWCHGWDRWWRGFNYAGLLSCEVSVIIRLSQSRGLRAWVCERICLQNAVGEHCTLMSWSRCWYDWCAGMAIPFHRQINVLWHRDMTAVTRDSFRKWNLLLQAVMCVFARMSSLDHFLCKIPAAVKVMMSSTWFNIIQICIRVNPLRCDK